MKKITDNQLRWALIILLIILPLVIIHTSNDEVFPRLTSVITLFTILPVVFIALALSPKEKPISEAPKLKEKHSQETLKKWDIGLKVFVIFMCGLIFYYVTTPVIRGTYRLVIKNEPIVIVEGTTKNQDSSFGLVFLGWFFKMNENDGSYDFWYPNMINTKERYRFKVLPGTGIVLDSEKIGDINDQTP